MSRSYAIALSVLLAGGCSETSVSTVPENMELVKLSVPGMT